MPRRSPLMLWLPVVAWAALIFILSSRPGSDYPEAGLFLRKSAHVFEFAVLALLLLRAWLGHGLKPALAVALAWLGATLYGATDELHQAFVPTRTPSLLDVGIDGLGAAISLLVVHLGRLRRLAYQDFPE